jgi:predicted N-acetyltransferase YhbS
MLHIDYLADHPDLAALLAGWHHREWADLLSGWSLEQAETELRSHHGRRCVPTTLVALDDDCPIGSVSLLEADLDGWEHLTPWLASLYVLPSWRGQGIGRRLVARAIGEAGELAIPTVYLFTAGQQDWYNRLGWALVEQTHHHGRPIAILRRHTAPDS